jgi:hypothetical protein
MAKKREPLTAQESHPLRWPDGWTRIRVPDRREKRQWQKTLKQYTAALVMELDRSGASMVVVTSNVSLDNKEPRDPGIAVYFTRRGDPDYSWMDILGVTDPSATMDQIDEAYKAKAKRAHPDAGGDIALWLAVRKAYEAAKLWLQGKSENDQNLVIACDAYTEMRWNIQSIRITVAALRRIEDCGASGVLDRAFKGFAALPAQGESHATTAPGG